MFSLVFFVFDAILYCNDLVSLMTGHVDLLRSSTLAYLKPLIEDFD